jgi:prepilin-type N-terminal cleavage/methylation domain-containing protein
MTHRAPTGRDLQNERRAFGFTLIEMAVVLVVVSLVLGSLLVPLASQVEQRRIDGTAQTLEQAREALLAFAAARGRLPCPAGATNGQEVLTTNVATGDCVSFWGFLPAATLGLSPLDADGYARDGWGLDQNRIRYAVRNATVGGQNYVFTKTGGIRTAGMPAFNGSQFLYVCNSGTGVNANTDCGSAFSLTTEAVAVIWSVGPNAALPGIGGASPDEAENPNPNGGSADRIFVSRPRATGTSMEYDDQMVWITPPILFQRMIAAGQLP